MAHKVYMDGNSLGHAAQHGNQKLSAGAQETTAIFGILRTVRKLVRERAFFTPVVLWDGRSWRHDRYPAYKANRADTPEKRAERERYRVQRAHMFDALKHLGITQVISQNMEADDLAAKLTRSETAKGNKVTLITGDKDWLQLVGPNAMWLDHKVERKCTHREFRDFTGYKTTTAFVHGKAMQGDTGDNVPGCGGIGDKGAIELLSAFDCVREFQALSDKEVEERWVKSFGKKKLPQKYRNLREDQGTRERFDLALELMDLNHPNIPKPEQPKVTAGPIDRDAFKELCARMGFISILNNFEDFLTPFINAKENRPQTV